MGTINLLRYFRLISSVSLVFLSITAYSQVSTPKPPLMGWASWNNYSFNISESVIKGQADAMVSSGLSAAGYKYINIDDGYFKNRNNDGSLGIDAAKFPNGMKVVADYIHSKGLKAGIYTDAGSNTCGYTYVGQAGGLGAGIYNHDQIDANLFFKTWGYDFLKVDYCGAGVQGLDEKTRYTAIKNAILNTGRTDVNYNVCRWQFPGTWVTSVADSWRISNDINNTWGAVTRIIDNNYYLAPYCSKGHYNDMDMLEVGRGMTMEEDKSHFSMWCIMSSPLLLGNDMTRMSTQTKTILTNTEVIAVNQDTTGLQAHIVTDNGNGLQVWAKNLNGRQSLERAVVLFNRTGATATMTIKWKDLNLLGAAKVRDLWTHIDLGTKDSMYSVSVPSHGVVMLKVVGSKSKLQETFEAEYAWLNNYNLTQNNNVLANQARPVVDGSSSGGAKASYIGNRADNYMEFRDVYASVTGKYTLTLTFLSGENRNVTMSVNGKDTLLTNLNSGSFSASKNASYTIQLKKDYNTIRFSNTSGWAPDVDKIHIDLNKYGNSSINAAFTALANNASFVTGDAINLTVNATTTSGSISNVKFYNGSTLLSTDNSAPYSFGWTNVPAGKYIVTAVATDNQGNTAEATINIKVTVPQGPYNGLAHPIPGTIQVEEYDLGGNGTAYFDDSPGSEVPVGFRADEDVDLEACTDVGGGYNLGYATSGEWLEYTIDVLATGFYKLDLRVACNGDGRKFSFAIDGNNMATDVAIPNTGGWQTWTTTSVDDVPLTVGQHILRLSIGSTSYVNINYFTFSALITGMDESSSSIYPTVIPNPFENSFMLTYHGKFNYNIVDLAGRLMLQGTAEEPVSVGEELQNGVYLLQVISNGRSHFSKIHKK